MDLEHRAELLVRHLVRDPVPRVAGVVHDDVELAELRDRFLHECLADAVLREVAAEDGRVALDLGGGLLGEVGVEVVHEDSCSVGAEQLCGRAADPARGAGDDRRLAVQDLHLLLALSVAAGSVRNPMQRAGPGAAMSGRAGV